DETLLIQSGKPVGVFRTHPDAPRVLIANSNLVAHWATWEHFNELDRKGLMMFGQMTAGSWIYIGSQGIVQGTYETFVEVGRQHFGGQVGGRWILTAGLGAWAGRSRWPPPWPGSPCSPSSAARSASPSARRPATSTSRPGHWTRHSRSSSAQGTAAGRCRWDCSATPARCCPNCCAAACGPTRSPTRPPPTTR